MDQSPPAAVRTSKLALASFLLSFVAPVIIISYAAAFMLMMIHEASGSSESLVQLLQMIRAIMGWFLILAIPSCLLTIILGHISRYKIKKDSSLSGKKLALAGLIISYGTLFLMMFIPIYATFIAISDVAAY